MIGSFAKPLRMSLKHKDELAKQSAVAKKSVVSGVTSQQQIDTPIHATQEPLSFFELIIVLLIVYLFFKVVIKFLAWTTTTIGLWLEKKTNKTEDDKEIQNE